MTLALVATLLTGPALAQTNEPQCAPRTKVQAVLANNHPGIALKHFAVDAIGQLVEVYRTPSGNWVLTVTTPVLWTCIIGSGNGWTDTAKPVGKES